jgi:hypothetical protein
MDLGNNIDNTLMISPLIIINQVIKKTSPTLPAIPELKILDTTYGNMAVHINWKNIVL